MTAVFPSPFVPGFRTIDGTLLNKLFANPVTSSEDGIIATSSGAQASSYLITASVSRISTVATAGDSVRLPKTIAGASIAIINDTSNAITVYSFGSATINNITGSTGVTQPANSIAVYECPVDLKWYQGIFSTATGVFTSIADAGNLTFTTIGKGVVQKQGANGKVGTFTLNGVTPVTVSNTSVAITDAIIISLNTVGGSVGAQPHLATITAGTGFTVVGTAGDTSVYNYSIISSAA